MSKREEIFLLHRRKGISLKELSQVLKVSGAMIYYYERGIKNMNERLVQKYNLYINSK